MSAVNKQAEAIVTIEQRRKANEQRFSQLIDAFDDFAGRGFWGRVKLLVLGR